MAVVSLTYKPMRMSAPPNVVVTLYVERNNEFPLDQFLFETPEDVANFSYLLHTGGHMMDVVSVVDDILYIRILDHHNLYHDHDHDHDLVPLVLHRF